MEDLRALVGVVTGGGDGIGRALALQLAKQGMHVAILDIRETAAEETAKACRALGVRSLAVACDVSICSEIEMAAERVRGELGPVNLIWANAGLGIAEGITTAKREALRWMYAVNVDGLIDTVRAFVPTMKAEKGWRWVGVTGSMAGLVQISGQGPTAYGATKYAGVGIAEALRAELAQDGIGVTLICPGTANTRIWDGRRARPDRFGGPQHAPETAGDRWRTTGMDVDEIAALAVDGLRAGAFYVVTPESSEREAMIGERAAKLREGVRMTSTRPGASH